MNGWTHVELVAPLNDIAGQSLSVAVEEITTDTVEAFMTRGVYGL